MDKVRNSEQQQIIPSYMSDVFTSYFSELREQRTVPSEPGTVMVKLSVL
jgi:hypothetical protein